MSAALQGGLAAAAHQPSHRSEFLAHLDWSIDRAQRSLLELQDVHGYWNAPLEANAQMNAEFVIFNHFMGSVDRALEQRIVRFLLDSQQGDGSWNLFPGGEGYPSYTIEAYAALKLSGISAEAPAARAARRWIEAHGGIQSAGTLARFYLAAIGQVPWSATAASPVEVMLFPNWFPFNLYELGSWARGTFVALAVLQSAKPVVAIGPDRSIRELYALAPERTDFPQPRGTRALCARSIFNQLDRVLRFYDRHHQPALRARALRAAERWLLEHQEGNGSFGGIEPCYLLSPMALKGIGYGAEHRVIRRSLEASRELVWEMGEKALYMPCVSPNWNTALASKALLASGMRPEHPALAGAVRWLVDHQIFRRGDWSVKRPRLNPGGWAFEFFNDAYPDVDDSAVILGVLSQAVHRDPAALRRALDAGVGWVMGMQSRDGGFAAFDVDTDAKWLNHLPLADVEAVTDPSCPDLTGRVLEMMGAMHYPPSHPVASRAIEWLRRAQSEEGSWWGRWGVNHLYGTFSALAGLRAIGADLEQPWIRRAVGWLKSRQNPDGGWGESPLSDRDPAWRGRGPSAASQTAWALIGLLAGEDAVGDHAMRGVRWLLERQNPAGTWAEEAFTGNGFPNHFYMKYYLYPHYFPLIALGQFRARMSELMAG